MNLPTSHLVLIFILLIGLGYDLAKDGKTEEKTYRADKSFFAFAIVLSLIIIGDL